MAERLTKKTFQEKIFNYEKNQEWKYEGELPAVVDFWAPWCGPCKMVGPIIDELSKEYDGRVNFYKVNTDEEQELGGVFGIKSIPSLLFIPKEGQPKMVVATPKEFFNYLEGKYGKDFPVYKGSRTQPNIAGMSRNFGGKNITDRVSLCMIHLFIKLWT